MLGLANISQTDWEFAYNASINGMVVLIIRNYHPPKMSSVEINNRTPHQHRVRERTVCFCISELFYPVIHIT